MAKTKTPAAETQAAPVRLVPQAVKPRPRIAKLDSLAGCFREMGRCYRLARLGEVDSSEAYRMVKILGEMRACLEASELERRLIELEEAHNGKG